MLMALTNPRTEFFIPNNRQVWSNIFEACICICYATHQLFGLFHHLFNCGFYVENNLAT